MLRRLCDRLESVWVTNAARYDRSGDWAVEGFVNSASSIRAKCRMQQGHVHAAVRLAHKLEVLPETAAAFAAGDVSRPHVEAIAKACTPEREAAIVELEHEIVDAARIMVPSELRGALRGITDALDGDGGAAEDEAQLARRRFHISKTLDGMYAFDGLCDGEDGEAIKITLDVIIERDRDPSEARTRPQRRMDAFGILARQWSREHDDGSIRRDRGHLSGIFDLAAYEGVAPVSVHAARAEYANGGRLSHATIERMLCDCQVTRIVTDGPSAILDLGFPTKVVPDVLWRALGRPRPALHASRAVTGRRPGATRITSSTARTAVRPRCTIWCSSAAGITASDTAKRPEGNGRTGPDDASSSHRLRRLRAQYRVGLELVVAVDDRCLRTAVRGADVLTTPFTELVGCRVPIQQAGMGGVAKPELAAAVANAGALGMIAPHRAPVEHVVSELDRLAAMTTGVFGINVLMPFLDEAVVEAAASRCDVVEFFYGDPAPALVPTRASRARARVLASRLGRRGASGGRRRVRPARRARSGSRWPRPRPGRVASAAGGRARRC